MEIYKHQYHDIVRIEIQAKENKELKESKSISFIKATLNEVVKHFVERCNSCLVVDGGVKVKVTIRISHPVKRWGDQKSYTLRISSIENLVKCLSEGIDEF
ncbi:hypothetical protein CLV62_12030 [Dysgonomonas alginatilytica]|uniref:Uncharacterized protein n=1 Tax=Dysgonomonas alginatilytica TaxID=1605892 RepID=A0A2V3PT58_9BACT|nr:hypothetical protein [Dysgonomonas alginatilytica]PXV62342.1 hypothetical protein CLV62_12030 [Dysgonomonas alginatilytica]